MNLFNFALGNLYRRPARTSLTVSAISLGIAAVVALTSIAWGFEASWQKANDARGTDLIVTRIASENTMPSPFVASKVQPTLAGFPHVQEVVGLLSEMLSVSNDAPPVFVFGWAYGSYLWDHLKLVDGRWPGNDAEASVVIGSLAAEMLHKKIGDQLEIEGRSFQVSGIYESPAVVENGAVLMTLTQAQQITDKPGKVNILNIKLDGRASEADVEDFKARVRATMPGYIAITSGELVQKNAVVRISKAMSNATILIAGLVGALVVFNTMLMSINERTREIGILLALGWQRRTIVKLVFSESTILTLVGGIAGIVLGIAITWGLEHVELMRGKIDAVFSIPFLFGVLGLSVVLGICGGIYPALKAARLLPSNALRQE
ncbi:ABC transporter permease [Ferrigenium kumadai]|uniref:ABC transporter permease n=1 Tax=Ferrigenium kumadai TaxID=1682490 RepID=A0AAN1SYT0_9PROT|nr:ABC transporter permease [Ferrigenium kumadai]BBI99071.1 ABC transporter permease [Ferrigenium kumadai]